MRFANLTLFFLFILLVISLSFLTTFTTLNFYSYKTPYEYNHVIYIRDNITIEQKILQMAENVSQSHYYKLNIYDCTDFSRDLRNNLSTINVSSYCISGFYIDHKNHYSIAHTWVGLVLENKTYHIEATRGNIIDDYTYKEDYLETSKGYCL